MILLDVFCDFLVGLLEITNFFQTGFMISNSLPKVNVVKMKIVFNMIFFIFSIHTCSLMDFFALGDQMLALLATRAFIINWFLGSL